MLVLDTSIWIEIYRGTDFGRPHLALLEQPEAIVVPTIIQFEIFKWLARERSAEESYRAMIFTSECNVQDLTTAVAVLAADLSASQKLHTTDAIIYATAQMRDAVLLTCDAHFKDLPGVDFRSKPE